MSEEMEMANRQLEQIIATLQKLTGTLGNSSKAISGAGTAAEAYGDAMKALIAAKARYNSIEDKSSKAAQTASKAIADQEKEVDAVGKAIKELGFEVDKTGAAMNRGASNAVKYGATFMQLSRGIEQGHKILTGFNQNMGVQTLTFANAYKSLIQYNDGMFKLTKTQRLFGKEGSNIGEALKTFRTKTTMSTVQALDFANSFNKMYLGVKPTSQEIAQFASELQSSFGPNVEKTKEVMATLLQLQQKYPPILNKIRKAHQLMAEGMKGDNDKLKEGKDLAASNIVVAISMGVDQSTLETMMQAQESMVQGEEDLTTTEKKAGKAAQSSAEAILNMGKTAESTFQMMGDKMEKTYTWLEINTVAATGLATALTAVGIAQNIALGPLGQLLKGGMKFGGKVPKGGGGGLGGLFGAGTTGAKSIEEINRAKQGGGLLKSLATGGGKGKLANTFTTRAGLLGRNAASTTLRGTGKALLGRGGGAVAGAANFGAGLKLGSDLIGAAKTFTKDKETFEKNIKEVADKSGFERAWYGVVNSGESIASALRITGQSIKAKAKEIESFKIMQGQAASSEVEITELAKSKGLSDEKINEIKQQAAAKGKEKREEYAKSDRGSGEGWLNLKAGADELKGIEDLARSSEFTALIGKELMKASAAADALNAKMREQNASVLKIALEYGEIKKTLGFQLEMQTRINDSLANRISLAEKFSNVSRADLEAQIAGYKETAKIHKASLENTRKIAEIGLEKAGVSRIELQGLSTQELEAKLEEKLGEITPKVALKEAEIKGMESDGISKDSDQYKKAQDELDKLTAKQDGLKAPLTEMVDQQTKYRQAIASGTDAEAKSQDTLITQEQQFQSALEQRLASERQLYEQAHFGMGASIKMLQKQIDLEKEKIKEAETYDQVTRQELATKYGINEAEVKSVEAATNKAQREEAISKIVAKYGDSKEKQDAIEQRLSKHYLLHNKHLNTKLQAQTKIFEMTKGMREGYLNAIMAMQVNAGEFTKIIGTQDKAVSQLMNTMEDAGQGGAGNTLALGGIKNRSNMTEEEIKKAREQDSRMKTTGEFTTGGFQWGLTDEQSLERASDLKDPLKDAKDIDEQIKILKAGAEAIDPKVLAAAVQQKSLTEERAKQIQNRLAAEKKIKHGKEYIPTVAEKEKHKPGIGTAFGEDTVNKSALRLENELQDKISQEKDPEKRARMQAGLDDIRKSRSDYNGSNDKVVQAQMERVGQKNDFTAADIKGGDGVFGVIKVIVDDKGTISTTLINLDERINLVQQATGIE